MVDPAYREIGLGRRLIGELPDVAVELGLPLTVFELVDRHESQAIETAKSAGYQVSALLNDRIRQRSPQ